MLASDFTQQLIAQHCLRQDSRRLALETLAAMWTRAPLQFITDSLDRHRLDVRHCPRSYAWCSQLTSTIRTTIRQLDPANLIRLCRGAATPPVARVPVLRPARIGALVFVTIGFDRLERR